MTLVKFNPFAPVAVNRVNNLDKWVNDFFNDDLNVRFNHATPSVNVVETSDSFKIEVAAPGLAKEDFKVNIEKDTLTVSAEKKVEKTVENEVKTEKYLRKEFGYSTFKRSFTLPENVQTDAVKANYENGILFITLPKVEVKKVSQIIDIQ